MIKVLFVCLGNICRSPMAEGVFQHLVNQSGLQDKILVDSAGTGDWHVGETAHRGTLDVLRKHGIPYNGRARHLTRRDLSDFTYVLAMDNSNLSVLQRYATPDTSSEYGLFLTYANRTGLTDVLEVPDPYYDGRFQYVYDLVDAGSRALLAHIREQHHL